MVGADFRPLEAFADRWGSPITPESPFSDATDWWSVRKPCGHSRDVRRLVGVGFWTPGRFAGLDSSVPKGKFRQRFQRTEPGQAAGCTLATMRVDIRSERDGGTGWVRVTCDAPSCGKSVEGRPQMGEDWPPGGTQDLRRTPASIGGVLDYCPTHAALAGALRRLP